MGCGEKWKVGTSEMTNKADLLEAMDRDDLDYLHHAYRRVA
jgi:hypothetical protein